MKTLIYRLSQTQSETPQQRVQRLRTELQQAEAEVQQLSTGNTSQEPGFVNPQQRADAMRGTSVTPGQRADVMGPQITNQRQNTRNYLDNYWKNR